MEINQIESATLKPLDRRPFIHQATNKYQKIQFISKLDKNSFYSPTKIYLEKLLQCAMINEHTIRIEIIKMQIRKKRKKEKQVEDEVCTHLRASFL